MPTPSFFGTSVRQFVGASVTRSGVAQAPVTAQSDAPTHRCTDVLTY